MTEPTLATYRIALEELHYLGMHLGKLILTYLPT